MANVHETEYSAISAEISEILERIETSREYKPKGLDQSIVCLCACLKIYILKKINLYILLEYVDRKCVTTNRQ